MITDQRGNTITQMIVVAGLLAIVFAAFADLIVGIQKEVVRMKNKQDRVMTNYVVDQALTTSIGIGASAQVPENSMLKACVEGGSTPTCSANCCVGGTDHEFILLDPRDSNLNISERARLAGTTQKPVYFDRNSNSGCTPPNCLYRVITKFKARCPGGVPSCSHAESLLTTVEIIPETGNEHRIKPQKRQLIYFVNMNYQPFITPIPDQEIIVGDEVIKSVYGNAGHPSEVQNFLFETCQSDNPGIAEVLCYGFMNGVGTIKIRALALGTTRITLQINDGGEKNNLSEKLSFQVTIKP